MTNEEMKLLKHIIRAGFLLIGKSDPDLKIGRKLAKQGLVDKLEDQAVTVAFFGNKAGRAVIEAAAPGGRESEE